MTLLALVLGIASAHAAPAPCSAFEITGPRDLAVRALDGQRLRLDGGTTARRTVVAFWSNQTPECIQRVAELAGPGVLSSDTQLVAVNTDPAQDRSRARSLARARLPGLIVLGDDDHAIRQMVMTAGTPLRPATSRAMQLAAGHGRRCQLAAPGVGVGSTSQPEPSGLRARDTSGPSSP